MQARLVHIVDDEEGIRRSTSFLLKTMGYRVQAWTSGVDFLKAAGQAETGAVLLDIRMPGMDGLEVQRELAERGIAFPVIILTGHGDIALAVRSMKAGAIDFLEKPVTKARLAEALQRAFARMDRLAEASREAEDARLLLSALTSREKEVLEGLAKGLPNKTISFDLGISARTVEVHRASVMRKLKARSFPDALRIAFAAGLG